MEKLAPAEGHRAKENILVDDPQRKLPTKLVAAL